jgi:diguanylate cyclase (GGDEF)-like protein
MALEVADHIGEMRDLTDESLTEQLSRERLLDMEARLGPVRRRAFAVLGLALIAAGPWIGFEFLIVLAAALAVFALADRRMHRSRHPWRWAAFAWAVAPLVIAGSAALTGGPESPSLMWLGLPVVTLGARFEPRGIRLGVGYTIVLLLLVTVGLDAGFVYEHPQELIFPFALVIAMAILGGAAVESEREHRRVAVIDPLTGLLNRSAFAQRLAELQHQIDQGAESALGFLMADIDHFKRVNDEHGHPVGDAVLRDVAYAMRSELRAFDLIYRLGGEEFAILLPGADLDKTREIAERLRAAVARSDSGGVSVTMSFGVGAISGDGVRVARLYAQADAALYEAKRAGRNRVGAAAVLAG